MCANYNSAIKVALENQEILTGAGSIDPKSLQSYLIKPVQRICRYPMILNEIIKLSNRKTYPHYDELLEAAKAVGRVTERVNEVQRAEENRKIKKELITRINSQKVNHMGWGDLLLYDKFSMSVQDSEQLYHVYLFDNLVLCCKETVVEDKRKSKDLLAVPPLEVKGKIFVTSITQIVDKIDVTNGVFSLQVFWNSGQHSFLLKCRNVEQVNLWKNRMLATAERSSAKHENPEMSAFSPPVSGNQKQIEVTIGSPVQARRPSTGRNQAEFPSGRRSSQSGMEPRPASGSNYGAPMSAGLFAHPSQMYPPSVTAGAMPSPRMAHNGPPKAALPMPPTRGSDSPSSIRTGPPRSARPNTPDLGRNRPPNSPLPTPPRSAAAVQPIDLKAPPPASPLPEPPKSAVERSSSRNSPPTTRPSTFGYEGRRSAGTRPSGSLIKLKTRYRDEIFILAIPAQGCPFEEILDKIERKIRICGAEMPQGRRIKLRYRDEDDDLVTINTDEDIDMAFELAKKSSERGTVNLIAD